MSGEFVFEILTSRDFVMSNRTLTEDKWNRCLTSRSYKEITTEAAYVIDELQQLMHISENPGRCEYRLLDSRGREMRRRVIR